MALALLDACSLHQEHEARRTAVHDRDRGRVDIDIAIVDTQTRQCAHQVLDRRNPHVVAPDRGRHARIDNDVWAQRDVDCWLQIDATEHDPCVGARRTQYQFDLGATVQADADGSGFLPEVRCFNMPLL